MSKWETLDYAQRMLMQLRDLVEPENEEMLTYLIEMAALEAADILKHEQVERSDA